MFAAWFAIPFWQRVLGAFVLGISIGLLDADFAQQLQPLGSLFIKAISMIVVPLIFCAIASAILQLNAKHQVATLALRTIAWFLLTAVIASLIGLIIGSALNIAPQAELVAQADYQTKLVPSPIEVLLNFIPNNPVAALAEGKMLQIILFAALIGIAIRQLGAVAKPLGETIQAATQVMYRITKMVLELTPIGVLGLMAWVVGYFGLTALLPLGSFIAAIYFACLIHMVLVYGSMVYFGAKMSPLYFFKQVFGAQLVAYTTCSSYGTLPVAQQTVTEKLGVKSSTAGFVLPLGASINMDGCGGIYPAIAAIFIAQLYGIPLAWSDYALITLTATLASVGTAGVPGTAMVMLTVTLTTIGLPLEGIAFIAAVDRIIDMIRTMTNVTGDMAVAVVVDQHNHDPA